MATPRRKCRLSATDHADISVKMIGGRMFISREELEELLTDDDNAILPLS